MSPIAIASIVFSCLFGSAGVGMFLLSRALATVSAKNRRRDPNGNQRAPVEKYGLERYKTLNCDQGRPAQRPLAAPNR